VRLGAATCLRPPDSNNLYRGSWAPNEANFTPVALTSADGRSAQPKVSTGSISVQRTWLAERTVDTGGEAARPAETGVVDGDAADRHIGDVDAPVWRARDIHRLAWKQCETTAGQPSERSMAEAEAEQQKGRG